MEKSRILRVIALLVGIAVLTSGLAACTLSASKGPSPLETSFAEGDFPVPVETDLFQPQATATKVAEQQAAPPPAVTATQAVVAPAAAPQPTEAAAPNLVPTEGKPPATYTIQKGEHPFCIARRFNINQSELLSINGLGLNSKVPVGFTLKIPQTGNPFVTDRALIKHPAQYTVKAGDTIYTIACAFGDVSPDMIALANNLQSPYSLSAGQVLQIP